MKAVRTLDMDETKIIKAMKDRASVKTYAAIDSGIFRPLNISKDVMRVFQENADQLGQTNPLEEALPIIADIKQKLFETPLTDEFIPELINPLDNLPEPSIPQTGLPPLPQPQTFPQFGQLPQQNLGLTTEQQFATLFPNDPLGQSIAARKRT